MQAVRRAFEANGLAPRDMVDVQSALYVVHSYTDEDAASFSREAIEAAMDAYDSYRQSGEHSDLFDAFGESRDYLVRSPRARPDRIYPSEPIAGFLRHTPQLRRGCRPQSTTQPLLPNPAPPHFTPTHNNYAP